jgi:hypothetical protein
MVDDKLLGVRVSGIYQELSPVQTGRPSGSETSNQHRKGMKIPTITNGRLMYDGDCKPTTRKKEEGKSSTGTRASHKVKILGDSHLRGTALKIDQYLNTKFKVCSWIKPGATTKEIVNTLVNDKVLRNTGCDCGKWRIE